jgi:beta-aspartyl-peptidase (threonine type)
MFAMRLLIVATGVGLLAAAVPAAAPEGDMKVVLVIHGGAGVISRGKMTQELEDLYRADLEKALKAGYNARQQEGGTGLVMVEEAIKVLENSSRFNAGKGAVFTHDGRNELDASIMEGKERRAGAVAGVTCLKNPISAARKVLEKSEHVFLAGRGAELFAKEQGLEVVDPSYFWTKERWDQLQDALRKEKEKARPKGPGGLGTVGAVARDRQNNLAAGTSTGGMTNKRWGRVGDSPVIGAGTYADNAACAVSCTGHGELFLRHAVAHDVAARIMYKGQPLEEAARHALGQLPKEDGGVGGLIALDAQGRFAMPYNTEGMYRGWITEEGKVHMAIYDR